MSQLPTEGQPINIRTQLTEKEWKDFHDICGWITSTKEGTLQALSYPATFLYVTSHGKSFKAKFSDGRSWYIPMFLLNTEPVDRMQTIKDKIKYLDQRYVTRQEKLRNSHVSCDQQKPVPEVSTDW